MTRNNVLLFYDRRMIKNFMKYPETHEKAFLLFLFIIGLLLRSIFVYHDYSMAGTGKWVDDWLYLSLGEEIVSDKWCFIDNIGNFTVAPGIPFLIALFVILFNDPIIPFFIYNIIITSLMIPVLYRLGKEIYNKKTGWFLAIWGVFYIEAYKYCPHILKETTLFLFVPLTILFIVKSIKSETGRVKNLVFASLSFAWLIHTDERFFVYFPVFILFFFLIKPLTVSSFIRPALLWIVFVLFLMLPWGIRNYLTFDQVVILSPRTTVITSNLWGSNLTVETSHFTDEGSRQTLIDSRKNNAMQFGNQYNIHPVEYGKSEARWRAFLNFWQPTYFKATFIQYGFRPMKWSLRHNVASLLFYGIFLPFYIIGFFILIRQKNHLALAVITIPFIHSLLHAYMVWPLERYRSPVTFIVVMGGIYIILEVIHTLRDHKLRASIGNL